MFTQDLRAHTEMPFPTTTALSLPIIDISPFLSHTSSESAKNETAQALYAACHEVGFFYLTGHGIPEKTQQAVLDAAREFFLNASEEEKAMITRKEIGEGGDGARGWQKLGENVTGGFNVGACCGLPCFVLGKEVKGNPVRRQAFRAHSAHHEDKPWLTPTRIGMKSTPLILILSPPPNLTSHS